MEEVSTFNIRPCRYPTIQKDDIEKMTDKMLGSKVIEHSTNAYSSSIVMVKKYDISWTLAIDYREINNTSRTSFQF